MIYIPGAIVKAALAPLAQDVHRAVYKAHIRFFFSRESYAILPIYHTVVTNNTMSLTKFKNFLSYTLHIS